VVLSVEQSAFYLLSWHLVKRGGEGVVDVMMLFFRVAVLVALGGWSYILEREL